jgi:hypothetical protein
MNEVPENDDSLEQVLDRALRRLPLRPAPLTLEARVIQELERRAAQPWWRHSFKQWPATAKAAFVAICGALIGLVLLGGDWPAAAVRSLHASDALPLSAARQAMTLVTTAGELVALLAHVFPLTWLYAGLAAGALLYATLFALGAAAYRTLYLTPFNGR